MKKFDITRFCSKDNIRPTYMGVCYRDGHMMASESHMLAYVTADYPQENEGKVLNPYSGRVIEGTFPKAEAVIENARKNTIRIKLDVARLKEACGLCVKGAFEWVSFSFPDESGEPVRVGVKADYLKTVIHGLEAFGITEARFDATSPKKKAILFESPGASFLLMPIMLGKDYIDIDGTISMSESTRRDLESMRAAAEKAAAESPETAGEVRKVKAAAKRAATYSALLEKAAAGVWVSEVSEPVKAEATPAEVVAEPVAEVPASGAAAPEAVPDPVKVEPEAMAARRKHARGYEARNGRDLMELDAIAAAAGRFGVFVRKPGNTIFKAEFKDATGLDCVAWLKATMKNEEAGIRDCAAAGAAYDGPDIQIREERRGVVYERIFMAASEPSARPGTRRRGLWGRVRGWIARVAAFAGVVTMVSMD